MATAINVNSFPKAKGENMKKPRKLFTGEDRRKLKNVLGALDQIGRRDGKVNQAFKEKDPRSWTLLNGTGIAGLTAGINKLRQRVNDLLAKTV